jgi:hypothetical protein
MRNLEEKQYPETFEFNTDEPNFPMDGLTICWNHGSARPTA